MPLMPIEELAIRKTVNGISCITNPSQPAYAIDMVQADEFWCDGTWWLLDPPTRGRLLEEWTFD